MGETCKCRDSCQFQGQGFIFFVFVFFFPFTKQTETPDAGQVTCVKEKWNKWSTNGANVYI